MTRDENDQGVTRPIELQYDTRPKAPLRTVDRPDDTRALTPEAAAVLRALVNETDKTGAAVRGSLQAPHFGERFSQRQLARKVLAGRSYQAVQGWLGGEPVPKTTAEWLTEDLRWVDARSEARVIRLAEDEIAIVVKR